VTSPFDRVRELLGIDLKDVPGATLTGEIPLHDDVIDRLVAQALARQESLVSAVRIESADGDRFVARVTVRAPLVPELNVLLQIERQPVLPESPVLWLHWSLPGLGPLAAFASPFLAKLKQLPPGIRIAGDQIAVDIAELLRARGFEAWLALVTRLELHTRAGQSIVRFELRTSRPAATPPREVMAVRDDSGRLRASDAV
jgi:hypothetical protein